MSRQPPRNPENAQSQGNPEDTEEGKKIGLKNQIPYNLRILMKLVKMGKLFSTINIEYN